MAAAQYRKKPVAVYAHRFDGSNGDEVAFWCGGEWIQEPNGWDNAIAIDTLEGTMHALPGDYVIQGVQGEFYPCKPDIFEATYEKVTD